VKIRRHEVGWPWIVVEETHSHCQQPAPFLANSWLQIFPQKF
jgi:hypothetical protein